MNIATKETEDGMPKFLAVDFFCGAGGTTRGLIDAGGYVIAGVDKVRDCAETYEKNNRNAALDGAHARYLQRDIFAATEDYPDGEMEELTEELWSMIHPLTEAFPKIPLLFSICAPCQPFTRLTQIEMSTERSEGRMRDRGLLGQSIAYIREFEPEMVLCENVAGIQKAAYGGVWQAFMSELEELGYITGSKIVNTSKFGVPQHRRRSIMLAIHKYAIDDDAYHVVDGKPMLIVPEEDEASPTVTVAQAIGHLPAMQHGESVEGVWNHKSAGLSPINQLRLEVGLPGGNNHVFIGTDLELDCHKKMRAKAKDLPKSDYSPGFSDVYCRMDPDQPAPAITTKFFASSCGRFGHFDTAQVRAISVREAARLQSFPDEYRFYGSSVQQNAKMVGNAVPPKLSEFFGRYMVSKQKSFVDYAERTFQRRKALHAARLDRSQEEARS